MSANIISTISRLKIGSTLVSKKGVTFKVREAVVMVGHNGGESPSLVVDRIEERSSVELFMTLGVFANMVRGSIHRPGAGEPIDWAKAKRATRNGAHRSF